MRPNFTAADRPVIFDEISNDRQSRWYEDGPKKRPIRGDASLISPAIYRGVPGAAKFWNRFNGFSRVASKRYENR